MEDILGVTLWYGLIGLFVILVFALVARWIFRVNEMANYQQKQIALLEEIVKKLSK